MLDTSDEALAVQAAVYRKMSGVRKLLIACQMTDSVRRLALARIKSHNPDFNDDEVRQQLIWELYGVRRQR